MNKAKLAEQIAEKKDISKKEAESYVDVVFGEIFSELEKGGDVSISGFGVFSIRQRKERQGINPATREKITIKATQAVGFKVAKKLKEAVK
jgi:DNA-binding protein HU-beta